MFNVILKELTDLSVKERPGKQDYILLEITQEEIDTRRCKGELDQPHYLALTGLIGTIRLDLREKLKHQGVLV